MIRSHVLLDPPVVVRPTTATLRASSPRAAAWREVFGAVDSVPITSLVPSICRIDGGEEGRVEEVFYVDLERLSPEVIDRAVARLSKDFNVAPAEVRRGLFNGEGLPILAAEVSVNLDLELLGGMV